MKFKAAISFTEGEKPFVIELAIPNTLGKFIIHKFCYARYLDAITMLNEYTGRFYKEPETILEFHYKTVKEFETNLELPFSY